MVATSIFSFPLLLRTSFSRSTSFRPQPPFDVMASTEVDDDGAATKLVTFIGKGGSGKTAAAIFAAQGMKLLPTALCNGWIQDSLVILGQDITVDYLLNCKIGTSHVVCSKNLSAVRLETKQPRCFLNL